MKKKTFVSGIILAAGESRRFGKDKLMQLWPSGRTVLYECVAKFKNFGLFDELILVNNPKRMLEKANLPQGVKIVSGGATRGASALIGAKAADKQAGLLCFHDAARPLVSRALVKECIDTAEEFGACAPVLKMIDTVKKVKNGKVEATLNRDEMVRVQTPQVLLKQAYIKACEELKSRLVSLSDDSQIFEEAGLEVRTVWGESSNIKITTAEDMVLAEAIYKIKLEAKAESGCAAK